jgi:hypothetical protein
MRCSATGPTLSSISWSRSMYYGANAPPTLNDNYLLVAEMAQFSEVASPPLGLPRCIELSGEDGIEEGLGRRPEPTGGA